MGLHTHSDVLQNLINHFYSGMLNFSFKAEDIEQLTWDKQQAFMEATVLSKLLKKYPVSNEFSKLFIKKLIAIVETHQEVHDEMYAFLCGVMRNKHAEDFSYRHYIIGNSLDNIVTIKETNKIVVNGTTGMRTWQAALILTDWILTNKTEFKNKNILELGSGVGFTGITVSKYCDINSMTMTDCHSDVLNTLCDNIDINFPNALRKKEPNGTDFMDGLKTIRARTLDWDNIVGIEDELYPAPDIIIGTDIVYDPEIIKPLCIVLKFLLDRNKEAQVFIASIIRNKSTYEQFLEELSNMYLHVETVSQTKGVFINRNCDENSSIIKIKNM